MGGRSVGDGVFMRKPGGIHTSPLGPKPAVTQPTVIRGGSGLGDRRVADPHDADGGQDLRRPSGWKTSWRSRARIDPDGVIWLSGDFDLAVAGDFPQTAAAALDGQGELVIDLSELTFLDSSGIRALLMTAIRCNRAMVLRKPPRNVRRVISLTGIVGQRGIRLEE